MRGIVQLGFVLAPQVIVLGTIVVAAGEKLSLDPVREKVRAHSWQAVRDGMRIEAATLGEELPYMSALCAAMEGLESE